MTETATKQTDEIAALRAELAELKATVKAASAPAVSSEREAAEWRDQMHRLAEARMSRVAVSPEVLRDYARACPTSDIQDLVRHGTVQGPSQAGASGQVTAVRGAVSGLGTGWAHQIPLSNPPGTALLDRQLAAEAAREQQKVTTDGDMAAAQAQALRALAQQTELIGKLLEEDKK
jgi:hypothetical protein